MSDNTPVSKSSGKGFLIIALILTFVVGILFCAKVNPAVANGMNEILGMT